MTVHSPCLNFSRILLQFPDSTEFAFILAMSVAPELKTEHGSWLCWSGTERAFFHYTVIFILFLPAFHLILILSVPVTLEKVNRNFTLVGHISGTYISETYL